MYHFLNFFLCWQFLRFGLVKCYFILYAYSLFIIFYSNYILFNHFQYVSLIFLRHHTSFYFLTMFPSFYVDHMWRYVSVCCFTISYSSLLETCVPCFWLFFVCPFAIFLHVYRYCDIGAFWIISLTVCYIFKLLHSLFKYNTLSLFKL